MELTMKSWKYVRAAVTVSLLSIFAAGASATEGAKKQIQPAAAPSQEMVGRLIVKPRGLAGAKLNHALEAGDARGLSQAARAAMTVRRAMSGGAHVLQLNNPVPLEEARAIAARLQRDGSVEYAEPDLIVRNSEVVPNDPFYNGQNKQWHYFIPSGSNKGGANLPNAWHLGDGTGVVVAVLDTGHVVHEDLAALAANTGYDFVSYSNNGDGDGWDSNPTDPGDGVAANECGYPHAAQNSSWHGLHVTGTIAALMNNAKGGTGVAPAAQIVPVRVLGKCGGYMSDVVDAMRWAAGMTISGVPANTRPAHVLNLSLGASGSCSNTFQQAVADVLGQGKIIVAAAGNEGAIGISQPANCSGVLAVTAHAIDGDNADYSNIGTATAISAPGGGCGSLAASCVPNNSANGLGVLSTFKSNGAPTATGYALKYGTSMATPHVTGVVALMLQQDAGLTNAEIRSHLQSSAAPHPQGTLCRQSRYLGLCGEGVLDANAALQKAINAAPTLSLDSTYQVVAPGTPVTLSGRGDVGGGFLWSQSFGEAVGLSATTINAGVATANFAAPASGVYTFQLEVTQNGQTGKATATVRVNSAPALALLPSQTVVAGDNLSFYVSASDGEGDVFSFHAVSVPAGATLDSDGRFNWPSAVPVGTHVLSYYAVDETGTQSAIGTVEIVVIAGSNGGGGGGGGSLDWISLLALGLLTAGFRWQSRRRS